MHNQIEERLTALGAQWDREAVRASATLEDPPHACRAQADELARQMRAALADVAEATGPHELVGRGEGSVLEQPFRLKAKEPNDG